MSNYRPQKPRIEVKGEIQVDKILSHHEGTRRTWRSNSTNS